MGQTPLYLTFPLPSPCRGVCAMDAERRYCKGCLRTIPEIKIWGTASEEEKWAILQQLKTRRHQEEAARPREIQNGAQQGAGGRQARGKSLRVRRRGNVVV